MERASKNSLSRRWVYLFEFRLLSGLAAPVLCKHYPTEKIHPLINEARREFERILPSIPYIGGKRPFTEFLLFTAMLLALHRVNLAHGKTVEQTGIMIYEIGSRLLNSPIAHFLRLLTPINFSQDYYSKLNERAFESHKRIYPGDYVYNYVPGDGKTFDYGVDYIECGGLKFLQEQGASELAPYLCTTDLLYSRAFGWGLSRTMTLAQGAERCDFRFKKGGKTHVRVPRAMEAYLSRQDN